MLRTVIPLMLFAFELGAIVYARFVPTRYFCWAPGVVALEAFVRLLATYDYVFWKRKPYNWAVATTTKQLAQVS